MKNSYYDTVPETPENVEIFELKASSEEKIILQYFREHAKDQYSPCQIWKLTDSHGPLTNFRRAITNLTAKGFLEKSGDFVMGIYGRRVNSWRLKISRPEPQRLF